MRVKTIIDEDFINYKIPSMFIGTVSCNGKCCIEAELPLSICHNNDLRENENIIMLDEDIITRYLDNHITEALVFGGLEPFEQFDEIFEFIMKLRRTYKCNDPVVIYTGYYPDEIQYYIKILRLMFSNIIVKYGRFIPNDETHIDEVLGVELSSKNQFAKRIC